MSNGPASPFQLSFQHKIGILYCRAGQGTEEEMYNNETAGPAFEEFLDLLGQRVRLKGFSKYRAQLDNKSKLRVGVCSFSRGATPRNLSQRSRASGLDPRSCRASWFGVKCRFPPTLVGSTFVYVYVSHALEGQFFLCNASRENPSISGRIFYYFPLSFNLFPALVYQG